MLQLTYAHRLDNVTGNAIRDIFHLLSQPGIVSFAGGNPSARFLEPDVIAELCTQVLERDGKAILQYGATEGYAPLKESIAAFLEERMGLAGIEPAQVLPCTGSTQAIHILLQAMLDPGDTVLCEAPTFLGTLQAMKLFEANIVSVPMDEDGVDLAALEKLMARYHPKLFYTIPTFQNPTGRTLCLERRQKIAELGAKYNVVILEDDPYREMRYAGQALPTIKSFDETGHVVYCTSFSKLISPGLRVGAAICTDQTLMRKMVICKQSANTHSSNLDQAVVDAYLRKGILGAHIDALCAGYKTQLDAMLAELKGFPKSVSYTHPQGGMFIWCTLPKEVNALTLLPLAAKAGVAYVPGTHFYAGKGQNLNTMRLNFSNAGVDKIAQGMTILKTLLIENGLE